MDVGLESTFQAHHEDCGGCVEMGMLAVLHDMEAAPHFIIKSSCRLTGKVTQKRLGHCFWVYVDVCATIPQFSGIENGNGEVLKTYRQPKERQSERWTQQPIFSSQKPTTLWVVAGHELIHISAPCVLRAPFH